MNSDDVLKLCNDERSIQMLEESMYKNDDELLKGYKYHLNLIKLIALCVEGSNGTTILKCQSVISLEDLARVLCNSSITNAEVGVCCCLFVCLFVCWFVCWFICLFVGLFVCGCYSFICLFVYIMLFINYVFRYS